MSRIKTTLWYVVLGFGALTMIMPLLWMLSTALKTPGDVYNFPPKWIPNPAVWTNFTDAWHAAPFGRFFLNSMLVSTCVTIGQLITSSMAAFAFARLRFPGRDVLFFGYLATMMVPGSVTLIPAFIIIRYLGWVDTYWALIVPGIFSAYGTFMLRQFLMGIPRELEEASMIDGCGHLRIFLFVVIPLSKPALATLSTFTFIGSWGNFMWPLIVTSSIEKKTLPIGLMIFHNGYAAEWTLMMAASLIVLIPVILLYIFNQRFFVESVKMSGMGGA